jgi:eukaryotic-like serine/threonine-protein kinase
MLASGMSEGDGVEVPLALATTQVAPVLGQCFEGRYRIEEPLGDGGMGLVYRARHIALGRPVALKVLRKGRNECWVSRRRFEREARALGQLVHPNIVAVTDSGVDHDAPFLVMELLNGIDLASRVRAGALSSALASRYVLEALEGLAFVHERGLVHRDIKPGNIFLEATAAGERVKLLDFGLARLVTSKPDAAITRLGEVLGTPAYMAPEQVSGEAADARTDVYAMGLVFYEMLTARRAFTGSNEIAVLHQQMVAPVPRLSDPALAPLDAIIQRATQKLPEARFEDAKVMRNALAEVAGAWVTSEVGASRAPRRSRASQPRGRGNGVAPSTANGILRAGAVLVSCLALAAISIACAVIYLIESPGGEEWRGLLQRAFAAAPSDAEAPK